MVATSPLVGRRGAATSLTLLSVTAALGTAGSMSGVEIVASSLLGGALLHLALVFPAPSALVRFTPAAVAVPYLVCALPAGLGLRAASGGLLEASQAVEAVARVLLGIAAATLLSRLGRAALEGRGPDAGAARHGLVGCGLSGAALLGWWAGVADGLALGIACLGLPLGIWLAITASSAPAPDPLVAARAPTDPRLSVERIARGIAHSMLKPVGAAAHRLRAIAARTTDATSRSDLVATLDLMDHAQRLMRDLLDLARAQGRLERRQVGLERLLTQARAEAQQRFPEASIELDPAAGSVPADEVLVRCLLVNLIENALEAAGSAGWVAVRAEQTPTHARLIVEDRAGGLPQEVEEHLFDPFVTTKPGGTGLGLAVVQEVCRAHGGRVDPERTAEGTRFVVSLPSR